MIAAMFKMRGWAAIATIALAGAGAAARGQTPIPPAANDFAAMAAQSDAYEIMAGRTALAQSIDPRVRSFAQQMIDDHTRKSQDLRKAAAASGLQPPPPAMGGDLARLLGALQSLTGTDFDRSYVRQQILAHDQALAVAESYAAAGTDTNLRAAARSDVPLIQHHLQMVQQLRAAISGS